MNTAVKEVDGNRIGDLMMGGHCAVRTIETYEPSEEVDFSTTNAMEVLGDADGKVVT